MITKKCENCEYEQNLRENRRAKTSWRCYDCGHANKLSFVVIAVILAFGSLGLVYAAHDNVPFDFWNVHFCTFMGFPLENGTTLYEYECVWTGFENMIYSEWQIDEPNATMGLPLQDAPEAFIIIPIADRPEIVEPEPKELTQEEKNIIAVEEKRAEQEREQEALIGKLAECRTGLGGYAAFMENAPIEGYANKTRWDFAERDNLSNEQSVLIILKAIEECRIMEKGARAGTVSPAHLNAFLADMAAEDYLGRKSTQPATTDQSDSSVFTDPLTDEDFAEEIEEAEKIFDDQFKDPYGEFTGENRGFQPLGLKCQMHGQPAPVGIYPTTVCPLSNYDAHILRNWDNITYSDILQLQCDNFLYIYIHKVGTHEFPVWLEHCVPRVLLE